MSDVSSAWFGPDANLTFSQGGLRSAGAAGAIVAPPPVETIGR